jgi:hypothetical protein
MIKTNPGLWVTTILLGAVTACSIRATGPVVPAPTVPHPTATAMAALPTASPSAPATPTGPAATASITAAPTQPSATGFCTDNRIPDLILSLKTAIQTSNGALLASLVSQVHGMDVRLFRNGRVVKYDREHVAFLFDSTYQVDWGAAPGSGLETKGSFRQLIVPALLDVLTGNYTLACNEIRVGGTTYQAAWPYSGIDFYSVYFAGTDPYAGMDWHTWLIGTHYVQGKPYVYAIMQFQWEP